MDKFRSMSAREGRMQMDIYYGGGGGGKAAPPESMNDLRSYSTSSYYAPPSYGPSPLDIIEYKEVKIKKSKSKGGGSSTSKNWILNDPELQRKKRVASYKVYSVEGKMKGSFKKGFRWIKDTCSHAAWW